MIYFFNTLGYDFARFHGISKFVNYQISQRSFDS
jgi:hypothetical protein